MPFHRSFVVSVALTALYLASVPTEAAQAQITSHRAAYTLTLDKSKSSAGIAAIEGAMFIEWQEVCDGWTISQRMRFQAHDADGDVLDNDISFASWESRDGLSYRFTTRTVRNGNEVELIRGRARLEGRGRGGEATFSEPEQKKFSLDAGTIFPTEHSIALIAAAKAGERVFQRKVFDGATFDAALEINAIIGAPLPAAKIDKPNIAKAAERPAWRVRMAFFKLTEPSTSPEYETSMRMLDNGIGSEFVFDYEEFSIRAVLDRLEELPEPRC